MVLRLRTTLAAGQVEAFQQGFSTLSTSNTISADALLLEGGSRGSMSPRVDPL